MFKETRVTLWAFLFIFGFSNYSSIAQTYYQFSVDSGSYNNLTGATPFNTTPPLWDDEEVHIPIGFDFEFYDLTFDSLYVSDYVWFIDATGDYWIDAYSADFIDRGPISPSSPRSYKTEGAVGNRIMKIEWNNAGFYYENSISGTTDDYINLQLWLYEDSSKVEIRYGTSSIVDPDASLGGDEGAAVGLNTVANRSSLSGTAETPNLTSSESILVGTPSEGTIYVFEHCPIPVANFSWHQDSIGLYQFQDSSANALSYFWEFGDGTSSTDTNATHSYSSSVGNTFQVTLTVTGFCGLTSSITTTVITGIESFNSNSTYIGLSPNPSSYDYTLLTISSLEKQELEYTIYDMLGTNIYSCSFNKNQVKIDLSGISSGTYFIVVTGSGGSIYSKTFVKN
ncbi:MAG: T9SS type A sorting domain-containing protein [Flavobacteriales bacterium]|nr:T9SS type A sorting domain-containing protein [Flavobacteriales bacterium]